MSKIISIGTMAEELFDDMNGIILYSDEMKDRDLREISITHDMNLEKRLNVGDKISIGLNEYTVSAIGDVALSNLKKIGHCTLKFTDSNEVDLPGEINIVGVRVFPKINDKLEF